MSPGIIHNDENHFFCYSLTNNLSIKPSHLSHYWSSLQLDMNNNVYSPVYFSSLLVTFALIFPFWQPYNAAEIEAICLIMWAFTLRFSKIDLDVQSLKCNSQQSCPRGRQSIAVVATETESLAASLEDSPVSYLNLLFWCIFYSGLGW